MFAFPNDTVEDFSAFGATGGRFRGNEPPNNRCLKPACVLLNHSVLPSRFAGAGLSEGSSGHFSRSPDRYARIIPARFSDDPIAILRIDAENEADLAELARFEKQKGFLPSLTGFVCYTLYNK
jgi:hypothetical protein